MLLRNHPADSSLYLVKSSGTFWSWPGLSHTVAGRCALAHSCKGDKRCVTASILWVIFPGGICLSTCNQSTETKVKESDIQCLMLGSQLEKGGGQCWMRHFKVVFGYCSSCVYPMLQHSSTKNWWVFFQIEGTKPYFSHNITAQFWGLHFCLTVWSWPWHVTLL